MPVTGIRCGGSKDGFDCLQGVRCLTFSCRLEFEVSLCVRRDGFRWIPIDSVLTFEHTDTKVPVLPYQVH